MSNKKSSKIILNKKLLLGVVIIVFVIVGVLFYVNSKPFIDTGNQDKKRGSTEEFKSNYNQAMEAWNKDDKTAAKRYAQKVIDENNNLSVQDQSSIQGQAEKMDRMANIVEGKNPE